MSAGSPHVSISWRCRLGGSATRRGNFDVLGIARQQALDVARLPVASAGVVAFGREQMQDLGSARRRVEADGIAGAAAARRIVGQDQRETPLGARLGPKPRPGGGQPRHVVHAIGRGLVMHAGEFQARIGGRLRLEGDGAGQQPAVELGQDDVHGEVGGREAALRVFPGRARAARQHDLQHRHIGVVEHRRVVLGHGRERRGVEDDRGLVRRDQRLQLGLGQRVFQAVHRDGERRQALAIERFHQRGDRRGVGRHQVGAIEDDQRHRAAWLGVDRARRPGRPAPAASRRDRGQARCRHSAALAAGSRARLRGRSGRAVASGPAASVDTEARRGSARSSPGRAANRMPRSRAVSAMCSRP